MVFICWWIAVALINCLSVVWHIFNFVFESDDKRVDDVTSKIGIALYPPCEGVTSYDYINQVVLPAIHRLVQGKFVIH